MATTYTTPTASTTLLNIKRPLQIGNEGAFESDEDINTLIKQNLKSLLLTRPGERFFRRSLGSKLYYRVFEQKDENLKIAMAEDIKTSVSQWMNYVSIESVYVFFSNEKIPSSLMYLNPPTIEENDVWILVGYKFSLQNKTISDMLTLRIEGAS